MSNCLCGWSEWCKYCDPFKSEKEESSTEALEQKLEIAQRQLQLCKEQRNDAIQAQGDDFYWDFDSYDKELEALALIKPDAQKAGET